MKKIKLKKLEVIKDNLDLFYNKEQRKRITKKIEKNKPLVKKVFKHIKKFSSLAYTMLAYSFIIANFVPLGVRKDQNEIEKSIELLNADNSYYPMLTIGFKSKLGIELPEFYWPLVVPYGVKSVDIVVPSDMHIKAKTAIKDSLIEYNSVLKAMKKEYSFNYCEDKPSHIYSIDVNFKELPGCVNGLNSTTLPLMNGLRVDNKIFIDPALQTDYCDFRAVFTHELLHSFGIADQYLVNDSKVPSIMGYTMFKENFLQPNDIKYLFATLYDVKTQEDVDYVNDYIDYHMHKYKNNKFITTDIEKE